MIVERGARGEIFTAPSNAETRRFLARVLSAHCPCQTTPLSGPAARRDRSLELDLDTLQSLPRRALRVVLECAGHRRAEFESAPKGIPWAAGAVAEARWTGTSLAGLLELAGIPGDAREVVLEGADAGLRARNLSVRGIAWGGTRGVAAVLVRVDGGPWTAARVRPARGTYARAPWETQCRLTPGVHEIACRAIDGAGGSQPERPPNNVRGSGNNAIQRIRVRTG